MEESNLVRIHHEDPGHFVDCHHDRSPQSEEPANKAKTVRGRSGREGPRVETQSSFSVLVRGAPSWMKQSLEY